jgi:hypothetical protein
MKIDRAESALTAVFSQSSSNQHAPASPMIPQHQQQRMSSAASATGGGGLNPKSPPVRQSSYGASPKASGVVVKFTVSNIGNNKKLTRIFNRYMEEFENELSREGLGECTCFEPIKFGGQHDPDYVDEDEEARLIIPEWHQPKPSKQFRHIAQLPNLQELYVTGNAELLFPREVSCFGYAQVKLGKRRSYYDL